MRKNSEQDKKKVQLSRPRQSLDKGGAGRNNGRV